MDTGQPTEFTERIEGGRCCSVAQTPMLAWRHDIDAYQCQHCMAIYTTAVTELATAERRALRLAMERSGRIMARAAERCGITRHAIARRIARHKMYGLGRDKEATTK